MPSREWWTEMSREGVLIKLKSDKELIVLAHSLQEEVGQDTFILSDLVLRAAVLGELEERGFIVKEVLKIEHSGQVESRGNNQDKGGDERLEESKSKEETQEPDWSD